MNNEAIKFIDRLYRDLYLSEEVLHHSSSNKTDKYKNIKEYLDMLEDMHERASMSETRIKLLKRLYYDKYVIKPDEIPESFYEHQRMIALEQGHGHITITEDMKEEYQRQIIIDQIKSLDVWLDYFLSEDAKIYPFWAKYWAFHGMLKLGTYNKETATFNRRTKNTTSIFADLNREALALSIDMMIKVLKKESINDKDLEVLVKGGSFQRIYTYILNKTLSNNNIVKRNEGIWVKYDRGSDHIPLVNSLQGYNTGWCTAGEAMARIQLQGGDFYVYYTLDENGEYKVPRIAIRMSGNNIGEIRGVAKNQNLEPEMEDVVTEKIKDFPDKDKYYKRVNDMKRLTAIYNANKEYQKLSIDDLRFLYEVDEPIVGFGYQDDPRIKEILSKRNPKFDLSIVLNCDPSEVSLDGKMDEHTKVNYGDIFSYEKFILPHMPEIELGDLYLQSATNISNFNFPKKVTGDVVLQQTKRMVNVTFPETIGGGIYGCEVEYLSDVTFPKVIPHSLHLISLNGYSNITLPEIIEGNLSLENIRGKNELVLPKTIGGRLNLNNLKTAKYITMPEKIGDSLYLNKLSNTEGLKLPEEIGGTLQLCSLESAKGLKLPKRIGGSLALNNLKSAEYLNLPEEIGGAIILSSLTSAEGLIFPGIVHAELDLSSIQWDHDLHLPKIVKGSLYLNKLKECKELVLPDRIFGTLLLWSLHDIDTLVFPTSVEEADVRYLKKANNLIFKEMAASIYFPALTKVGKLVLPELVLSDLDIRNLVSADEIVWPKEIRGDLYIHTKLLEQLDQSELISKVDGEIFITNGPIIGKIK